jgi:hypothetical protein
VQLPILGKATQPLAERVPGTHLVAEPPVTLGAHDEYTGVLPGVGASLIDGGQGPAVIAASIASLAEEQPGILVFLSSPEGRFELAHRPTVVTAPQRDQTAQRVIAGPVEAGGVRGDGGQRGRSAFQVPVLDQQRDDAQQVGRLLLGVLGVPVLLLVVGVCPASRRQGEQRQPEPEQQ